MKDTHPLPIMISGTGSGVLLERVPLTGATGSGAYDEDWLQKLMFKYPEAVPVAEINDTFSGLIPICRELGTPAGPIDILYATRSGRIAVLEAKLWRNPEARRKVIGQILDYAKELSHWTYETLDAAIRAATRRDSGTPKSLVEIVSDGHESFDEARFIDAVSRSLRRGDLLLLIAGDGIRENVGAITNFIEDHGTLHFTFGLVEMAIYQTPDGSLLVHPRVLAQSTIIRRIVVELRDDRIDEIEEISDPESRPDLEETWRQFREFWTEFLTTYQLDDSSQPLKPPTKSTNQYYPMPKGSDGWMCAVIAPKSEQAGVYLTFKRSPISDRIYAALSESRTEIDEALGQPDLVKWSSTEKFLSVAIWKSFGPDIFTKRRIEVQTWLGDFVNRFVNAFRPRIESLLREE